MNRLASAFPAACCGDSHRIRYNDKIPYDRCGAPPQGRTFLAACSRELQSGLVSIRKHFPKKPVIVVTGMLAMSEDVYRVKLTDIFEGPMDLLLFLIKKNEVNIYDIPIALITDQYLDYLRIMQDMNIDLAGDFIVMAATLTQIKSKMLLPVHEEMEEPGEDPRLQIARPLAEYIRIKDAAEKLLSRSILGEDTFIRFPEKEDALTETQNDWVRMDLFELIDAFQRILKNISPEQRVDLSADRISVKDRISEIIDILEVRESVTFDTLFEGDTNREMIVVTFLAILEMVRLALIRIRQQQETGIIRIFYQ